MIDNLFLNFTASENFERGESIGNLIFFFRAFYLREGGTNEKQRF